VAARPALANTAAFKRSRLVIYVFLLRADVYGFLGLSVVQSDVGRPAGGVLIPQRALCSSSDVLIPSSSSLIHFMCPDGSTAKRARLTRHCSNCNAVALNCGIRRRISRSSAKCDRRILER
jgi:hypothetical protein